jgi:hypothetical protein
MEKNKTTQKGKCGTCGKHLVVPSWKYCDRKECLPWWIKRQTKTASPAKR